MCIFQLRFNGIYILHSKAMQLSKQIYESVPCVLLPRVCFIPYQLCCQGCWNSAGDVHCRSFMLSMQLGFLLQPFLPVVKGPAAGTAVLQEEPSLYQSPLSHQSVSSFGSPSPRPAAPPPPPGTPNPPPPGPKTPESTKALSASIAKGQFHLRKMSHSFEPKGRFSFLGLYIR